MTNIEKVEINEWRNEHGEPDFNYLESFSSKADNSLESLEKIHSIAEDLDVVFDSDTTTEEIVEKIRLATQENEDGNSRNIT